MKSDKRIGMGSLYGAQNSNQTEQQSFKPREAFCSWAKRRREKNVNEKKGRNPASKTNLKSKLDLSGIQANLLAWMSRFDLNILTQMFAFLWCIFHPSSFHFLLFLSFWADSIQLSEQLKGSVLSVSQFPELSAMVCELFIQTWSTAGLNYGIDWSVGS